MVHVIPAVVHFGRDLGNVLSSRASQKRGVISHLVHSYARNGDMCAIRNRSAFVGVGVALTHAEKSGCCPNNM